jgi:hypothetical protein
MGYGGCTYIGHTCISGEVFAYYLQFPATVSFGSQPAVSSNASPSLVGGASFPSNAATGSIEGQIPVIYSTEQLIREAGWVDDDDEEHPIMPGGLGLGSGSIGMFREASFSSLNKDLNASVPLKNSLFAGDDDPSDEEYIETKKTAEAIRRSFALDLFSPIKLPDGIEDTLAPSKRVKPEPFSLDMSDLPVETPVEPSVSSPISSSAIPVPKPRPTLSTAPTQPMKQSPEDSTAAPDEFANIPQSMAEIYKLSNQNKKRKKTKKKETREDGAQRTPDSPFYLNDGFGFCFFDIAKINTYRNMFNCTAIPKLTSALLTSDRRLARQRMKNLFASCVKLDGFSLVRRLRPELRLVEVKKDKAIRHTTTMTNRPLHDILRRRRAAHSRLLITINTVLLPPQMPLPTHTTRMAM